MSASHLWQGEWLDDEAVAARLPSLAEHLAAALSERPPLTTVLSAAAALADDLLSSGRSHERLCTHLVETGVARNEAATTLHEIGMFLQRHELERKIMRELGRRDAGVVLREDFRTNAFEGWAPLGVLVHVTPTNALSVAPLSVMEGLLTGNVNVAKLSASDNQLTSYLLDALASHDASGRLARQIIVLRFSSKRRDWLHALFSQADGIAVWGGEEAVDGVRAVAPAAARIIEWGPKISFAYITADRFDDARVHGDLATEICTAEQQACASPQVVYLDTDDRAALGRFAQDLAKAMREVSPRNAPASPSPQESAEINNTVMVARLERHLQLTDVIAAEDGTWRILVDHRSALRASPLYRTIWVKPLPRQKVVTTLRPMRRYLQTVGLACPIARVSELTRAFFDAGVLRVRAIGSMLDSYAGEPHDGVYALQRYSRRVSVALGDVLHGIASIDELDASPPCLAPQTAPVMSKQDFQNMVVAGDAADLFFHSGGSSGAPKLSVFRYEDYDYQMQLAARGLYAAGLDPRVDRCMNLFFAGGLYGGFVSFFSILERMHAVQLPMAAHHDFSFVAATIIEQRVDTLLGMPTYLHQLFVTEGERLRKYAGVRKIFYGGEHVSQAQRDFLRERFGIRIIRSATYGSVDAGPLGFQCPHCVGSEHHLHAGLLSLEILRLDADEPVAGQDVGRLVFTSHARRGQKIERYDIGDIGRWVAGACRCGRSAPRFELLGRHGDVFRIATCFINYRKLLAIAVERLGYAGELQLRLREEGGKETLVVWVERTHAIDEAQLRDALLAHDSALNEAVHESGLTLSVERVAIEMLTRVPSSGKLRPVVDERGRHGR